MIGIYLIRFVYIAPLPCYFSSSKNVFHHLVQINIIFALFFQFIQFGTGFINFLFDGVIFCFPVIVVIFGSSRLFACRFQRFEFFFGG